MTVNYCVYKQVLTQSFLLKPYPCVPLFSVSKLSSSESRDKQCLWKHGEFVYNYQICTLWEMSAI